MFDFQPAPWGKSSKFSRFFKVARNHPLDFGVCVILELEISKHTKKMVSYEVFTLENEHV